MHACQNEPPLRKEGRFLFLSAVSALSVGKRCAGLPAEGDGNTIGKVRLTPFPPGAKTESAPLLLLFHQQTLRWFADGVDEETALSERAAPA